MKRVMIGLPSRFSCLLLAMSLVMQTPAVEAAAPTNTAADVVPADCAFFSTSARLQEQFDAVAKSRAVKRILELPTVQMGLAQLQQMPQYQQAMEFLETPLPKEILAAATDALSQEVFLYGGNEWTALFELFVELNRENQAAVIQALITQKEPKTVPALVNVLLEHQDLQLPSLVLGLKIQDKQRIDRLFEELRSSVERLPQPPPFAVDLQEVRIGDGSFISLQFSGLLITESREEFVDGLRDEGVDQQQAEQFFDWLRDRTVTLSVGYLDSYVMISLGADNRHLERFGKGPVLADSASLEPVQAHLRDPSFIGLTYGSREIRSISAFDAKSVTEFLENGLDQARAVLPAGLADRLSADIPQVMREIEPSIPKRSEFIQVSLLNRGIETYSYSRSPTPGIDYGKPLSILRHAGAEPLVAFAYRAKSSLKEYGVAIGWSKKLHGYWVDFGLPMLEEQEQAKYEEFAEVLLPLLNRLDQITRTKLLPATDAGQGLFVLDTELEIQPLVGPAPFPKPMPMLELAIAITLNDRESFLEAMEEYVQALEEAVPKLAAIAGEELPEQFRRIPRPTVTPFGETSDMYSYGVVTGVASMLGRDVLPHVVISDDLLLFSVSPKMSRRLLKPGNGPADAVIALDKPSGSVSVCRPDAYWDAVRKWVDFAMQAPGSPLAFEDPQQAPMVRQHLAVLWDVLGTFKGAASRSYQQGEYLVTHTWSHFEDLPE